ncbi:MAG: hypothetical protein RLZZ384_1451, partial [Pseudomonadota bacterium]
AFDGVVNIPFIDNSRPHGNAGEIFLWVFGGCVPLPILT